MTTFDIDNTRKTKYKEVLESLVEQGRALQATHNPNTWRLSALTFALHLHDCYILFSQLKEKWSVRLPFSEAWDVDFSQWKTEIWTLVNNVSSFTEESVYEDWHRLCEEDYQTFIGKANECLSGALPLKELMDFLFEKKTELKKVVVDIGRDLSTLFQETETMLYNVEPKLYEQFYKDMVNIYMSENVEPYQIEENGIPTPYERWKASKNPKRLPELILSKTKTVSSSMLEVKFWQDTWGECFDIEQKVIDKEGFARFIFQNRKNIIENKQYPCKNCLGRCFATLCLCEHLWKEHNLLLNPEANTNILKERILPHIQPMEDIVKDERKQIYPRLWNQIFENAEVVRLLKEASPTTFKGGYNQKLVCNIIGMMCDKGFFTKSKNKIDEIIYTDKTVYKYLTELKVTDNNTSCAMTANVKRVVEEILDTPS